MRYALIAGVAAIGLALGGTSHAEADPETRCQPMKDAGARIVMAREAFYPEDMVVASAVQNATSEAVAQLLRESIAEIYKDLNITEEQASEMMFNRCVALAKQS